MSEESDYAEIVAYAEDVVRRVNALIDSVVAWARERPEETAISDLTYETMRHEESAVDDFHSAVTHSVALKIINCAGLQLQGSNGEP